MNYYGDIKKIKGNMVVPVDIITGGSPCQDLSIVGHRAGLNGERSGLFLEQVRLVKEMRKADEERGRTRNSIRPRFMVWENVPGAFSSGTPKGGDFRRVLEEIVRIAEPSAPDLLIPRGGWSKAGVIVGSGWSIAWRTHDAQYWGVPQRRKRICLIADFGGKSAPEILFERESVSGNIRESVTLQKSVTPNYKNRFGNADIYTLRLAHAEYGVQMMNNLSPTLTTSNDQTLFCIQRDLISASDVTEINEKEYTKGQIAFDNCPVTPQIIDNHLWDGRFNFCKNNVCPTLLRSIGAGGNNAPMVLVQKTFVEPSFGQWKESNVSNTIKASGGTLGGGSEVLITDNDCKMVRRLTPLECERLQGFPDGWTDIGEWTDSKGKTRQTSDSQRYKALGNSIALPFWKWMAKRMVEQYPEEQHETLTMASLFDGIGGFPLSFMDAGVTPVWVSEIEEFPIAVTKRNIGETKEK